MEPFYSGNRARYNDWCTEQWKPALPFLFCILCLVLRKEVMLTEPKNNLL